MNPLKYLLSCFLMCYEDAAFPLLMEEFRASDAKEDLFSQRFLLPSLVRTGRRFYEAILEMLCSEDPHKQVLALAGLEAYARWMDCRWVDFSTNERLMEWIRMRAPFTPAAEKLFDSGVLQALIKRASELLQSIQSEIRNSAIRALANPMARDYLNELTRCASHAEVSTRLAALQALAEIGDRSAIDVFLDKAGNGEPAERRAAAEILGRWKVAESAPLLIRLVEDPEASVRRVAVTALREIGGEEADAVIASFVRSPDKKIRKMAAEVISGKLTPTKRMPSELTEQRLLKIRPNVVLDAYISTDAVMRFALPEIRPYEEKELTSLIASVCGDYSTTRRRLIELRLFTRAHRPGEGCVYEFTELGKAVWRVERFIVERYLRRMV